MRCPECGSEINAGDLFCGNCGWKVNMQEITGAVLNKKKNSNTITFVIIGLAVLIIAALTTVILMLTVFKDDTAADTQQQAVTSTVNDSVSLDVMGGNGTADNTGVTTVTETAENTEQPELPPVFTDIEVSSTRGSDVDSATGEVVNYYPAYLTDGNYANCWTPDRRRDSSPYILLKAKGMQRVHGVRFADGYFKSEKTYNKNRRISKVEIVYNGGSVIYECTEHVFGKLQDVVFAQPVDTDFIQIKILSTLYGEWLDICVSEVEIY